MSLGVLSLLCISFGVTRSITPPPLRFRADGTFKVLQLADLHYGEGEEVSWGPEQDVKSTRAIRAVLQAELPDLVVFSGDQITGNNVHSNATLYWQQLVEPCEEMHIPWAAVFGNHDTLPLETLRSRLHQGPPLDSRSTTSRRELMAFDTSHPLSHSVAGNLPDGKAVSNFVIDIARPGTTEGTEVSTSPASRLYFFDTGGGDYDEVVYADQVAWFQNVSADRSVSGAAAFAYFHIPLPSYTTAWGRAGCVGMNENGGVTPTDSDAGLFQALVDAGVRATFVGHDHGNDWCCPTNSTEGNDSLWMCFGRHSGYGGYGHWARGARVLNLQLSGDSVSATSWVRLESGEKLHEANLGEAKHRSWTVL